MTTTLTLLVDHVLGLQRLYRLCDLVRPDGGVVQVGGGDGAFALAALKLVLQEHQLSLKGLNFANKKSFNYTYSPKGCVRAATSWISERKGVTTRYTFKVP